MRRTAKNPKFKGRTKQDAKDNSTLAQGREYRRHGDGDVRSLVRWKGAAVLTDDDFKDTFDYLYRHEAPSLINLTVHTHFGGRPLMSAMLHELLRYMKGFPGVWFARPR